MTPLGVLAGPRSIAWLGDTAGHLRLIDQTRLPTELVYVDCRTVEQVWEAIRSLRVRGAPAISIAAAFGVVLGSAAAVSADATEFAQRVTSVSAYLRTSRPTAVNLFRILDRLDAQFAASAGHSNADRLAALLTLARTVAEEDRAACYAIGQHGAARIADGAGVLTHCNTGNLATYGYGTAIAAFYVAKEQGKRFTVYADETRPLLQGARLTAWELQTHGIDVVLICDSMAAAVMAAGKVAAVFVGADRIAANGDTANKIGTYGLAVLAHAHGIPFYVAAPTTTFDLALADGSGIPIEERAANEITHGLGGPTAPPGVRVFNPAFDVTPARLITALLTERGVIEPVTAANLRATLDAK
jgi:methylthioribose-1-phosphate isomerase